MAHGCRWNIAYIRWRCVTTQRPELFTDHVLLGLGLKSSKLFLVHFVSSVEGWIALNNSAFGKQLHEVSKKKNCPFVFFGKNNRIRVWNKAREMMTHFLGWSFTLKMFVLSGLNLMENVGWMFCDMITLMYKSHTDLRDSFLSLHLLLVREQEENVAVISQCSWAYCLKELTWSWLNQLFTATEFSSSILKPVWFVPHCLNHVFRREILQKVIIILEMDQRITWLKGTSNQKMEDSCGIFPLNALPQTRICWLNRFMFSLSCRRLQCTEKTH